MKKRSTPARRSQWQTLVIGVASVVIALAILLVPWGRQNVQLDLNEYSTVCEICELATLRSYYHNVAMYEEKPNGAGRFFNDVLIWPFGDMARVGYKQFWLEYSGTVEVGIDASELRIDGPDEKGVVRITMPEARVLSVDADENTLTRPLTAQGWFTSISAEEKANAFTTAQNAMRQEAENDTGLLRRAKDNAMLILEQHIINTGKAVGQTLTVEWVEHQ